MPGWTASPEGSFWNVLLERATSVSLPDCPASALLLVKSRLHLILADAFRLNAGLYCYQPSNSRPSKSRLPERQEGGLRCNALALGSWSLSICGSHSGRQQKQNRTRRCDNWPG